MNRIPAWGRHGILIDCGLLQGQKASGRASAEDLAIDFSIEQIRALLEARVGARVVIPG
jgi:metallo-beta-lactamase family protein